MPNILRVCFEKKMKKVGRLRCNENLTSDLTLSEYQLSVSFFLTLAFLMRKGLS